MNIWKTIITTLGGTSIAVAALVYLTKSIVNTWLSKSVESYKAELRNQYTQEIEHLRQALQIQAQQEIAKTVNLQKKQSDAGPRLCRLLHSVNAQADFLIKQENKTNTVLREHFDELENMYKALNDCYYDNYIYFPDILMSLVDEIRMPLISVVTYLKMEALGPTEKSEQYREAVDTWVKEHEKRSQLTARIEIEIQKILGVEGRVNTEQENSEYFGSVREQRRC